MPITVYKLSDLLNAGNAYLGFVLGETVTEEEFSKRYLACFGNDTVPKCEGVKYRESDNQAYCGECKCGTRDLVLLETKIRKFARLKCPLNKF